MVFHTYRSGNLGAHTVWKIATGLIERAVRQATSMPSRVPFCFPAPPISSCQRKGERSPIISFLSIFVNSNSPTSFCFAPDIVDIYTTLLYPLLRTAMSTTQTTQAVPLDQLVLVVASAQQIQLTWRNTCKQWGRGLDLAVYRERERLLAGQAFTSEHLTVWVLVPREAQEDAEAEPLAHCETFLRPALTKAMGEGEDGVRECSCISIATVFCPEEHRGHGYGRRMMQLLYNRIPTLKPLSPSQPILGSALYSDIGNRFYASIGWRAWPSYLMEWPVVQSDGGVTMGKGSGVQPLSVGSAELEALARKDEEGLRADLARVKEGTAFAILPTKETYAWHHARASFYAAHLHAPPLDQVGALLPSPGDGPPSFVIWTLDHPEQALVVLRHRFHSNEDAHHLGQTMQATARAHGFPRILAWYPALQENQDLEDSSSSLPPTWASLTPRVKWVPRPEDSIPSLALFPVMPPAIGSVTWVGNEKYAWV